MKVYEAIAIACDAMRRCNETGNAWADTWEERLTWIERNVLPSGSGFNSGTTIDRDSTTGTRIVLETSFHHMDGGGGYDGWTDHKVIISPHLIHGITFRITGRNRNDIKSYIGDVMYDAMQRQIEWSDTV